MDNFIKFTSCMRRYINSVIQSKRKGLMFYTQYDNKKNIFMYPKYSMIFSCPEGSPEKLEPYSYMSKEKVLFGVLSNVENEIKTSGLDKFLDISTVYNFSTGDCAVHFINKTSNLCIYKLDIEYKSLCSSDDITHKRLPVEIIITNYDEFYNTLNTAISVMHRMFKEVDNDKV